MTGTGRDHSFQQIDPVRALRTPAFELTELREPAGFAEHDRRLEELAREAAGQAASRTELLLAPLVDSLSELTLDLGDEFEDLLEDARANVREGDHAVARELLEEYLERYPDHQEARYLRAYCLFHLDGEELPEALRILRPLRDEPLEAGLRDRVGELRRELRRRLTPAEITAYAATEGHDPRAALARLAAYLELAPEEGTLSWLLALGQARAGDLELALATAERGAAAADGDGRQVADLARRLRLALLSPAVQPAVEALKDGLPHRAREVLSGLGPDQRGSVVLDDLDLFVGLLIARPQDPPAPRLPADRLADLYELIAGSDTQLATRLLGAGRLAEAERLLSRQLALVPGFPWLNFLYAICLLRLGRDPDRAASCAATAERDPGITQAADLREVIQGWQESLVVNPAVDEYLAAMEAVRDGTSADRLTTLRARLDTLRRRLPELRRAARTEIGVQTVEELAKAIDARLTEIGDALLVGGLFESYDRVMSPVQGGIRDEREATRLAAALDALAQEIRATTTRVGRSAGARAQLDELAGTVAARRGELDRVTAALKVSALVQRFNRLAEKQTSLVVLSASQARTELNDILRQAAALRHTHRSTLGPQDRTLLDDLIGAITRTLR